MALTASGDKSGALVSDGVCSALQGQSLTPTESLEENGLNIHCRQAGLEASGGNSRDVSRGALYPGLNPGIYCSHMCASVHSVVHYQAVRETLT